VTESERSSLAASLGRIEGLQEAQGKTLDKQNSALDEINKSLSTLHKDNAAMKTEMRGLKERISKLEPTVVRHDQTDAEQRGASRQEREDDAGRNAFIALVLAAVSVVVAVVSRWWGAWTQ